MNSINQQTHEEFLKKQLPVFYSEVTNSTNAWAKREFHGQTPFALYLADQQTQGRGRGENTWSQSTAGSTLLSTWCLRLNQIPQPLFPLRVGLLLFETCLKTWPQLDWALKAPNDIYILDAKWAGILIEAVPAHSTTCCFIGIGANIYEKPSLETQKTTALSDWTSIENNDWALFCHEFYKGLLDLQKDPSRQTLLPREIEAIEYGLKKYIGNNVQNVAANGSLVLKSGETVHWSEL